MITFGENSRGQLGRVTDEEVERTPWVVESMRSVKVVQICCGKDHTLALTSDSDLYGFGANDCEYTLTCFFYLITTNIM